MEKIFNVVLIILITIVFIFNYVKTYRKTREKIDGVETIDGIQYLVRNTDIEYVMTRLSAVRNSEIIKGKTFKAINESTCEIKFGGIKYDLNLRGSDSDMNIGATYRIECVQNEENVVMKIKFISRDFKWYSPSFTSTGLVLNQAYHRYFKEILDLEVLKMPGDQTSC